MKYRFYFIFALLILPALSFVQKKQITIFLVGDSTMADKPLANGNPELGWGQIFPLYLKEGIRVENHAVNGRSSKSFRDEGKWAVVFDKIKPGDYVIIEFGHNDQKSQDSTRYAEAGTAYRQNLIRYVEETRKKKGIPILATPIVRRRFDENGVFYDTHTDYPDVVREVAKSKNVPLLDLHLKTTELLKSYGEEQSKKLFLHIDSVEYESLPKGREDDTHLSAVGAFRVCDLVKEEITAQIPALKSFLKD